jgi:hypothetical protein
MAAVMIGSMLLAFSLTCVLSASEYVSGIPWPEPKVVNPGPVGGPPCDALVLFGGHDLSQWVDGKDWIIKDGYAISAKHDIHTKRAFGDCQLHVEFATPEKVEGHGQERGNSGVYMMSTYEIQVLDSYKNETYFDGQCASIYKQRPPLVNACRKPGEWQSYDIVFEAPRFDKKGKLCRPAFVTVLQNGVLVQNHTQILGASAWDKAAKYVAHPAKMPLLLQFHGNALHFRNIWIRELPPSDAAPPAKKK